MWPHLIIGLGFGGAVFRVFVVVGFLLFFGWLLVWLWLVVGPVGALVGFVVTLSLFYGQQFIADCPAHKWA